MFPAGSGRWIDSCTANANGNSFINALLALSSSKNSTIASPPSLLPRSVDRPYCELHPVPLLGHINGTPHSSLSPLADACVMWGMRCRLCISNGQFVTYKYAFSRSSRTKWSDRWSSDLLCACVYHRQVNHNVWYHMHYFHAEPSTRKTAHMHMIHSNKASQGEPLFQCAVVEPRVSVCDRFFSSIHTVSHTSKDIFTIELAGSSRLLYEETWASVMNTHSSSQLFYHAQKVNQSSIQDKRHSKKRKKTKNANGQISKQTFPQITNICVWITID